MVTLRDSLFSRDAYLSKVCSVGLKQSLRLRRAESAEKPDKENRTRQENPKVHDFRAGSDLTLPSCSTCTLALGK